LGGTIDDQAANLIDDAKRAGSVRIPLSASKRGYRKYMSKRPRITVDDNWYSAASNTAQKYLDAHSPSHVIETTHFIRMLRDRLTKIPLEDHDEPLQFPLVEVGYSVRCINRLQQHASHNSSNFIMNLAEAIFETQRVHFHTAYGIKQFVIYLIWNDDQAEIAEVGFSKLTESYTHNGGGFSHYPAGLSNHSASKVSGREWSGAKMYMLGRSPLLHNRAFQIREFEKLVIATEKETDDKF
jgi:hypothetical protein